MAKPPQKSLKELEKEYRELLETIIFSDDGYNINTVFKYLEVITELFYRYALKEVQARAEGQESPLYFKRLGEQRENLQMMIDEYKKTLPKQQQQRHDTDSHKEPE